MDKEMTKEPITMHNDKYAYCGDPYTAVRILCIDRNAAKNPVVSMDDNGYIFCHKADGRWENLPSPYDLVPLQCKPMDTDE
jgi:hypothetical protein